MSNLSKRARRATMACVAAGSLTLLSACGSGSGGSGSPTTASGTDTTSLKAQIYAGSVISWLDHVAAAEGFFKKNNIEASIVPLSPGGTANAALAGGSIDLLTSSVTLSSPLLSKGEKFDIVSGADRLIWSLVMRSDVKIPTTFPANVKALKGKSVAVPQLGADAYFLIRAALQDAGVPVKSVNYVPANSGAPTVTEALLQSHQAAGAMTTDPAITDMSNSGKGYVALDMRSKIPGNSLFTQLTGGTYNAYWVRDNWAKQHPQAVHDVRLALMETDCWMHDSANMPALLKLLNSDPSYGMPKGLSPDKQQAFVTANLPISYYPKALAGEWMRFAAQYKIIPSALPTAQFYLDGTPESPADVYKQVTAAGGSCPAYANAVS